MERVVWRCYADMYGCPWTGPIFNTMVDAQAYADKENEKDNYAELLVASYVEVV